MVGRLLNELKRASEEAFGSFTDIRKSAHRFMDETEKQVNESIKDVAPSVGGHNSNPRYQPKVEPLEAKQEGADEKVKSPAGDDEGTKRGT
jgi:hypothetical protein